jgi:hypothetical protein
MILGFTVGEGTFLCLGGACRSGVHADVSETLTVLPVFRLKFYGQFRGTLILALTYWTLRNCTRKLQYFLYPETCGVRNWGKKKENGGAGYVAIT